MTNPFAVIMQVTRASCVAPQIVPCTLDGTSLSAASGAFYRYNDRVFLISNWHVFSGVNPATGQSLSGHATPHALSLRYRSLPDGVVALPHETVVQLWQPDMSARTWLEHPTLGRQVDVAALDVTELVGPAMNCANDDIQHTDFALGVGDRVFVLGYPKGISGGFYYPIWKQASIASEPVLNHSDLPRFLIDCSSTEGMSGAPVIFRGHSYLVPDASVPAGQYGYSMGKTIQRFMGLYSGRVAKLAAELSSDPMAAQLGFVWKREAIHEVVAAGRAA